MLTAHRTLGRNRRLLNESDMACIWVPVAAETDLTLPPREASTNTNIGDPTLDNLLFALAIRPGPMISTATADSDTHWPCPSSSCLRLWPLNGSIAPILLRQIHSHSHSDGAWWNLRMRLLCSWDSASCVFTAHPSCNHSLRTTFPL